MSRPYVGLCPDGARVTFRANTTPTEATHGAMFAAVIGPFRTARAARFMAEYGANNPHCRTVAEAETMVARMRQNGGAQ